MQKGEEFQIRISLGSTVCVSLLTFAFPLQNGCNLKIIFLCDLARPFHSEHPEERRCVCCVMIIIRGERKETALKLLSAEHAPLKAPNCIVPIVKLFVNITHPN